MKHNARVYIAARSRARCEEAIEDLRQQTGHEAYFLPLDLGDLNAVRSAADEFMTYARPRRISCGDMMLNLFLNSKEKELHVLYNNG